MGYTCISSTYNGMDLKTEAGRQSAVVNMTLMQMVADAYEGAEKIWEKNSKREMVEGVDDPSLFGPNEAQIAIREWLTYAKFLPPLPRTQVSTPATEFPTRGSITPNTPPRRSKTILGLNLTTSPKAVSSGTSASSSRLPQSPGSPIAKKSFLDKIRRKSTSNVPTVPAADPDVKIPLCSSPTQARSATLPLPGSPVQQQLKTRPFVRPRRFSYKKRIRNLETGENDAITLSDAPTRPKTKPSPAPALSQTPELKLGPIDADTVARLGICFPSSPSPCRPRARGINPVQNEKHTSAEEEFLFFPGFPTSPSSSRPRARGIHPIHNGKHAKDAEEEQRPDVTLWTMCVVTALIHLFFVVLFLACVFVGLCRLIRGCFFWNEGE